MVERSEGGQTVDLRLRKAERRYKESRSEEDRLEWIRWQHRPCAHDWVWIWKHPRPDEHSDCIPEHLVRTSSYWCWSCGMSRAEWIQDQIALGEIVCLLLPPAASLSPKPPKRKRKTQSVVLVNPTGTHSYKTRGVLEAGDPVHTEIDGVPYYIGIAINSTNDADGIVTVRLGAQEVQHAL